MARRLFSTRFIAHQGLHGHTASVVVPEGHIYVVKQLTAYMNPLLGISTIFFIDDLSGAALWSAASQAGTAAWFGFYGALVFPAGQSMSFASASQPGDNVDVFASGYDLLE